jgi:hypothetical protein
LSFRSAAKESAVAVVLQQPASPQNPVILSGAYGGLIAVGGVDPRLSLPLLLLLRCHPSPQAEDLLLRLLLPVFPQRSGGVRFLPSPIPPATNHKNIL